MLLLCSCGQKITSRKEFIFYLHDKQNGLFKEAKRGSILTSAGYIPYELIAKEKPVFDKSDPVNRKPDRDHVSKICFIVSFSKAGKELLDQLDMSVYTDIFQTLSFRMTPLVSLRANDGRKLFPLDCFFQQTYGFSSSNELLVIFDSTEIADLRDYHLSIDEFGLGTGELSYRFLKNDIDKLNNRLNM